MDRDRIPIPKLAGHGCFACGTANPIGLNLQFYRERDAVCADTVLGSPYQGWDNMAHGGIISTLLDEVMSWTIIVFKRVFFVTRKMEVKYVKPVGIGVPLHVKGWIVDESRPPRVSVMAEILGPEGTLLAKSKGEFIILLEERFPAVSEDLKKEMGKLFAQLESVV